MSDGRKEIRLYVSGEMHDWIRRESDQYRTGIATFVRELIAKEMRNSERKLLCRSTDTLIEQIAEKMGIELPEKQLDFEGKKEGVEVPLKCGT